MAEFRPKLEAELAREFAPVVAPDGLWERIHEQRRPLRVRPAPWRMWSIATASLLVLLAGLVWRLGAVAPRPETADTRHASFYSSRVVAVAVADRRLLQRPCLLCHTGV